MHHLPPKPLEQRVGHSLVLVRAIAVTKLFKSMVLLFVGFFILHVLQVDGTAFGVLHNFVNAVRLDPNNHYIHDLLEKTLGVQRSTLRWLSAGTLIYSALYLIEGIGLFFDKGWAEWMTVITTAGFVPIELLEISREATPLRIIVFLVNVLILIYITMRLRWRHLRKVQQSTELQPQTASPASAG